MGGEKNPIHSLDGIYHNNNYSTLQSPRIKGVEEYCIYNKESFDYAMTATNVE